MSKYTMSILEVLQMGFDLGMQNYPIFDETHRIELNDKIIHYYLHREIGFETVEMFKDRLNETMLRIMSYYNQMYKSESVEFNPLYNIELIETFEHKTTGEGSSHTTNSDTLTGTQTATGSSISNTDSTTKGKAYHSEFPSTLLSASDIVDVKYANNGDNSDNVGTDVNVSSNTSTGNSSSTNTGDNTGTSNSEVNESYTKSTKGSSAGLSFSHAIKQWRDIMINIDDMIIHDENISSLFLNLW